MTFPILQGEYGSKAYGTNTVDSDTDLFEVVVEPREFITGLYDWTTHTESTAGLNNRSTASDTDKSVYGLRKFCDLAVTGNPSILGMLFVTGHTIVEPEGQLLLDNRDLFVSKAAGHRFLGYMKSQREAMTGERKKRTNRPELVHKHGYDSKFGYHMIRLGLLGRELMETGTIQLPMRKGIVDICMSIRAGMMTLSEVLELSYVLEADLEKSFKTADLPDHGDRAQVSKIMDVIYHDIWPVYTRMAEAEEN